MGAAGLPHCSASKKSRHALTSPPSVRFKPPSSGRAQQALHFFNSGLLTQSHAPHTRPPLVPSLPAPFSSPMQTSRSPPFLQPCYLFFRFVLLLFLFFCLERKQAERATTKTKK